MLKAIKDRPMLFFVLSFVFGMAAASILPFALRIVIISILLILAVFIILRRHPAVGKMRRIATILPLIIGIIFGTVFHFIAIEKPKNEIISLCGEEKKIVAVVEEITNRYDYFVSYTVRIVSVNGEKAGFSSALSVPYDIGAEENDVISLNVSFSLPKKDDYGFSLREYYSSRGIYVLAESTDENASVIGFDRSVQSYFRSLSHKLSVILKTALGRDHGGLVSGLLLGRKCDVPDSVTTSYRYLGISHILSVSGLHLAILVGTLSMLLKGLTIRRPIRYPITIAFIIFYIFLTGASPSVVRSGIMLILLLSSEILGRDYDPITALSVAAFVIILFSPNAIRDASFILSVSATAGIVLVGSPIAKWLYHISDGKGFWLNALTRLLTVLAMTASATVFTLPAIWYYFGETSSVSLLSNIIFIPLNTALMYLSIMFLIFCRTPLAPAFAGMASSMAHLVTDLTSDLMKILPPPIDLTYPFTVITISTTVLVLILFLLKKRRALALVLSVSVFVLSYFSCLCYYDNLHRGEENVIFASKGENDYVIVNANGKTLICDFSSGSYSSARHAFELVQPKLHDTEVDTILLTHLHRKHIVMISRLSDKNRISQLFIPYPQSDDEITFANAIRESAEARGIKVITYNSDRDITFDFNGIKITLYQKAYIKRSVQPLHLMRIDGKRDFLYIGSAVFESELKEKAISLLDKTDVLFLGAHGPIIKEQLLPLNLKGEVLASNIEINDKYGTDYPTVGFYKKYITQ